MNKKWTTYNKSMENLGAIANEFQLSDIVARAMINRGVDTVPKVRAFLNNDLSLLNAPYLLKGMETAVDKIFEAIGRKNKICVYGDYD
ncbi:MAG TPA: single-stranded-DNA-specific exonuclease RecJ, partial [Bacillota bacterium]|nr:single-stranded-DNA-specific exonuclease RecJ [Bacillota bacterium]